ncbi:hypothetical protein Purlil1_13008 [Purpureocillium lilacinum]|uniref:Uncharacterized protein n=1 Tax=Purpureocillium lilacinum TaxID=33203 RepID=A0ABR0BF85_PURLI|nr:hypothetical protein Purlil1_13008 [Purpureocillium lilacinum]
MSTSQPDKDDAPVTQHVNFTYQLDEDDEPVTEHVDMGEIMFPRSGSETNDTAHHETTADAHRHTNGTHDPINGSKADSAQPHDSRPDDVQPDNAQTNTTQQVQSSCAWTDPNLSRRHLFYPACFGPFLSSLVHHIDLSHPRATACSVMPDLVDEILSLVNAELECFDDNARPLLSSQLNAFGLVAKLFHDEDENGNLSKQRRSDRARARQILADIYSILGPEVLLLCAFSVSISKLASVKPRDAIAKLRLWWAESPRPRGLTTTAASFCRPIGDILSSARKRKLSEIGVQDVAEPCEHTDQVLPDPG